MLYNILMDEADSELLFLQFSRGADDTLPTPETARQVISLLRNLDIHDDTKSIAALASMLELWRNADRVRDQIALLLRIATGTPVKEALPGRLNGVANSLCKTIRRIVDAADQKS